MKFYVKFILLFLAVLPAKSLFSQNLESSLFEKEVDFKIIKTQTDTTYNDFLTMKSELVKPEEISEKTSPEDTYWIQLDLYDHASRFSNDGYFYLTFNSFDHANLYLESQNKMVTRKIGRFDENNESSQVNHSYYDSFLKLRKSNLLDDGHLLIQAKRITFKEDVQNWRFTISNTSPNAFIAQQDFEDQLPYYFFTGLCFIMCFTTLSFYFFIKKSEFLWYSIYIVVTFVYVCGLKFGIYEFIFNNNYISYWVSQSFLFVDNIVYLFFFASFLQSKKEYPFVHFLVQVLAVLNMIILICIGVLFVLEDTIGFIFITQNAYAILNFTALLGLAYLMYVGKDPLAYVMALATSAYCAAPLIRTFYSTPEDGLLLDGLYYIIIGCSIEMVIFAFGLFYKIHLEFRENLMLQQRALFEKTRALRAQINPHFIFNSLSAIQHLVSVKKIESALKYLNKFSRLTRNVLESSMEINILLAEEIKMLEDYLSLELLRFDNSFSYNITIDETIDPEEIEIPSMILQPFVENALIHGLLPKKSGTKQLDIIFNTDNNYLICIVDDTGVGRLAAKERLHIYQNEKKSRGLEVTKLRLRSLGESKDSITIVDKYNENNHPMGTKVIVRIPLKIL